MVPWNKGRRLPVEVLTVPEIVELLRGCGGGATGLRNRALVVMLWRCGLRVSEALALHPKDVDAEAGTIRVLRGKGCKARVVGIDEHTLAVLARWQVARAKLPVWEDSPLFCTRYGDGIWPVYVRNLMRRLGKQAGLKKRVHPHGLRHTHASELRREGVDIGIISKQLGHGSVATTALYLDHVCPQEVIDAIRKRRLKGERGLSILGLG